MRALRLGVGIDRGKVNQVRFLKEIEEEEEGIDPVPGVKVVRLYHEEKVQEVSVSHEDSVEIFLLPERCEPDYSEIQDVYP